MTLAVQKSADDFRSSNTSGVSQAATAIDRRLTEGKLDTEFTKIAEISASSENPPSEATVSLASYYLSCIFARAFRLGSWRSPHITLSENGEIVFEWWHRARKITLYVGQYSAEYIKVWGTNIETEMDSGVLSDDWTLTSIWLWLHK